MTIREFVLKLWENDPNGSTAERLDLDTARIDLDNFRADGWDLPEGITPESYAEAWNELVDENLTVTNSWGVEVNYLAAVNLMDNELREDLARNLAPCSEQAFFDAYAAAHQEKFGEEFEPDKQNPCW